MVNKQLMQFTLGVNTVGKIPAKWLEWLLRLTNSLNFQVLNFIIGEYVCPFAVVKCLVYVIVD